MLILRIAKCKECWKLTTSFQSLPTQKRNDPCPPTFSGFGKWFKFKWKMSTPPFPSNYSYWVVKKATFLKKASFSRLKWIKPAKILCFFKHRIFSKMRHGSSSNQYKYAKIMLIYSARWEKKLHLTLLAMESITVGAAVTFWCFSPDQS